MNITVDRDFARFGAKSYAINKINTVEIRKDRPHKSLALLCMIVGGSTFFIRIIATVFSPIADAAVTLIMAIVAAAAATWGLFKYKIIEYNLYVVLSSAESQVFISQDWLEVKALRDQIESAMMGMAT